VTSRDVVTISWDTVQVEAKRLAARWVSRRHTITGVYGVPTGGAPVAALVAGHLEVPIMDDPDPTGLVVDDLVDTGHTLTRYQQLGHLTDALFRKPHSPTNLAPEATELDGWLAFPWERSDGAPTDAVTRIIEWVGEDPTREGLIDTPKRVAKAYRELTEGYDHDPAQILSTVFDEPCDQMVILDRIDFTSLCEHHLLPFIGTVSIGYVPDGKVVGLSKLARIVDCYARRFQIQERLTNQVAQALQDHLNPAGVAVIVRAHHSCMSLRGVRKANGQMVTSAMLGVFRTSPEARAEFTSALTP
jgi:GTP cyclohydrolase I